MYFINSKREPELEKIVGKFYPADDIIFDKTGFMEIAYFSNEVHIFTRCQLLLSACVR